MTEVDGHGHPKFLLSQILQDHPERGRRVEVTSNEVELMRLDE